MARRSVQVFRSPSERMLPHLHAVPGPDPSSPTLVVLVAVATLGASVLVGLAAAAFVRRRSRPYLLLLAAFAALLGRSAVVVASLLGLLSPTAHHFLEHGLDAVLVALVVAAVYYARAVSREVSAS